MFSLTDADFGGRILGCGDGPAAAYEEVIEHTRRNADAFAWDSIASVDDLGRLRMAAMRDFLQDLPRGRSNDPVPCPLS